MTKSITRKVSGPALERFLRQLFAGADGVEAAVAERLTRLATRTFTSVRVRRSAYRNLRRPETQSGAESGAPAPAAPVVSPAAPASANSPATAEAPGPASAFDPYAIGLVPTFQREGRAGLEAKLTGMTAPELKAMARAQKIALGDEAKAADASADMVRAALLAGVEKRIADRRAASS